MGSIAYEHQKICPKSFGNNEYMTNELNENLLEYTERLESALAEERPHTTFNRDILHAHVIILAVFHFAKSKVRTFSHELNDVVSGTPPPAGCHTTLSQQGRQAEHPC